jgi:hypothetical protein
MEKWTEFSELTGGELDPGSPSGDHPVVSPTVFHYKSYRFYFFSREEDRVHIHVMSPDGEAKFWLEPIVALARNHGLTAKQLKEAQRAIEDHQDEIRDAWESHFRR